MSTQHTPGPWAADDKNFIGPISREDDQSFGMVIPVAQAWGNGDATANARRIVQCVNSHDELSTALREAGDWFGLTKSALEQFEDLAEKFHKETGFLRPGKDMPMAAGHDEEREAERDAAWKAWAENRRNDMIGRVRAAIAKATGDAA
jgi:hypothetical protein